MCRHTAASYDYMQPAKKNVLITNVCCCSTRLYSCIGAHRAHILPQMNDLNWKLFFFFFFSLLSFFFQIIKTAEFCATKKYFFFVIFFLLFFRRFSCFWWMKIFVNFYEIFINLRHFYWVTVIEHTHTKPSDENGKKKSFFFHHLHSSELEHHYICEIYIKKFLYI